jgi:hypothetical protein
MATSHEGLRRRPVPSAKRPSSRQFQSNRILSNGSDVAAKNMSSGASPKLAGISVSKEEADAILQELANEDDDSHKTWSRLFVEKYLMKVRSYYLDIIKTLGFGFANCPVFTSNNSPFIVLQSTLGIGLTKICQMALPYPRHGLTMNT